jgi:hypothetical protein
MRNSIRRIVVGWQRLLDESIVRLTFGTSGVDAWTAHLFPSQRRHPMKIKSVGKILRPKRRDVA